jgi:hypothetical protein
MSYRWDDHVIAYGEENDPAEALWLAAAQACGGRTLYLLGVGFDPRCLVGLQKFLGLELPKPPVIVRLGLPPPSQASHPLARTLAADNRRAFEELVESMEVRLLEYPTVHERANAGPHMARALTASKTAAGVDHIIIDISSLPSTLYFPVIAATLRAHDASVQGSAAFAEEVQVVACENPEIDASIVELGVSDASIVGGFRGQLDLDSQPVGTTIWAPVIGEHSSTQLRVIHSFLSPDDTCPVLPFPARHPRRTDRLLLENQRELFDEFQVTPGNIIYADERNPFDLYRTLSKLQHDYRSALAPLQPTTVALSAHSSKLLSLGVLLAAYEHELPIVAAPATDYLIRDGVDFADLGRENKVGCIWLTGDPYR